MNLRILRLAAGLALFAALPTGAAGQATARLRLDEAVTAALAGHPSLAATRAEAAAADAALRESWAAWLPSLAVSGSATRYEEPMVATPIHGFAPGALPVFDRTLIQGAGSLSYTLFDGPGRPARVRQARATAAGAAARVEADAQALAARCILAYLDVLSQAELLAAQDARLAALAAEADRVAQRQAVGKAAAVEGLRLDATLAAAQAQRVHLASSLDLAERELARLTGRPVADCRRPQLRALRLTAPAATDAPPTLAANPALIEAAERVGAAAAAAGVARSGRWPQLKLAAALVRYDCPAIEPITEWNAGLSVSLPLFTGGALRARVAQAQAALAASRAREAALRLQTEAAGERAGQALAEARAQAASYARAEAGFAEVLRIEQLALSVGRGDAVAFLEAEAALAAARAGSIGARHQEIAARVEMARVAGALDAAWILREVEQTDD
jgi:outer membrane protein TolC